MEFEFETEIDDIYLNYKITAHVKCEAVRDQEDYQYGTKFGYRLEIKDTTYSIHGCSYDPEGKAWARLERIVEERADEYFFEKVAA